MNAKESSQNKMSGYTKTVNADEDGLSKINTFLSDPSFRILKITAHTREEVQSFIQSEEFCKAFDGARYWFVIAVEIESDSPPEDSMPSIQLNNRKPVILQWHSPSTKKLYYRNSGHNVFIDLDLLSLPTLSEEEVIEKLYNEGQFTFQVLLQTLKANLGGQLSDNLLTATLDAAREFDSWRLIDYCARDGDSLSLRWLLLSVTDDHLTEQNGCKQRTLEIAAQYATPECLSALLNLPFPATVTEERCLLPSSRDLLELKDAEGNTPLMIAAKHGKISNLQFLIDLGADIGDAIERAWGNQQYTAVKKLLEADSPFPQGFQVENIKDSELKKIVSDRTAFHKAIEDNNSKDIKIFIEKYPGLKYAYNIQNDSALTHALKTEQYNIYAFLQSQGYA